MISIYERLHMFMQMLHSCGEIGVWAFSEAGELYYSSSIHENELKLLFAASGCMDYAINEGKRKEGPFIMSDSLGLIWLGEYARLQSGIRMLVLVGPVFYTAVTQKKLENLIREMNLSVQFTRICKRILMEVPVVEIDVFNQYGRMLHCAITGTQGTEILSAYTPDEAGTNKENDADISEDTYERRYQIEQLILKCVEEGNHNYEAVFKQMSGSRSNRFREEDPHLSAVIAMATLTAQCANAAIRGGVPVKTAKMLEKEYVFQAQKTVTITELMKLNQKMLEAFIDKVNEYKTDFGVSKPIMECCIYVKEHLGENLDLQKIAKQIGYTEYYLTRKFKSEMGIKLSDYIKEKRIEYAKVWLISSEKSVQEIAEMLQFSDRSYFSKVFKSILGVSPEKYREQASYAVRTEK